MPNILDTVQISGSSYDLKDKNAPSVSAVTQQEYDNLPSSAKTSNTFFVISDATEVDISQYWTSAQTQSAINQSVSGKQDTLVSSVNIKTINNESLLGSGNIDIQGGGGKAVTGGTNISVTTGETADTINCTLPISADSKGIYTTTSYPFQSTSRKTGNVVFGYNNSLDTFGYSESSNYNAFFGSENYISNNGSNMFIGGSYNRKGTISQTNLSNIVLFGYHNQVTNKYETSFGFYNNSQHNGDSESGNTLFSVGNGTADNARHNAFEIRQNGDIYITSGGTDIKLQDNLGSSGGGGSSYTAGDGIDITNDVISVTGKANTSAVTAIQDSLSGYVTTDTEQIISGRKIFTYSAGSSKAIEFKQTDDTAKVGFRVRTSAATNNELASFEFRPNTFTVDGVQHPLLYFGHYRSRAIANAGVPQTYIGFRQYDQLNAAAYHYLIPLPEKAKTPFSLTTSFKDYYAPMGFKNGSTMITADDTGVVDLSSELGGLKLVKLSQAEYDALATKDSNVLYVIVG